MACMAKQRYLMYFVGLGPRLYSPRIVQMEQNQGCWLQKYCTGLRPAGGRLRPWAAERYSVTGAIEQQLRSRTQELTYSQLPAHWTEVLHILVYRLQVESPGGICLKRYLFIIFWKKITENLHDQFVLAMSPRCNFKRAHVPFGKLAS